MSVAWQIHQDGAEWASQIAGQLASAVSDGGTLIVTGGSSPAPIYDTLAAMNLPWDDITLLLSDDRCVNEDHDQSNLKLVRQHLAQAGATIPPLTEQNAAAAQPYNAGLLGMGPDGHILSWFDGAGGFDTAMTDSNLVCDINASNSTIAQPITNRISLTRAAVARCKDWHIAIKGDDKRVIAEQAIADPSLFPVGKLLTLGDDINVTIHWCP